MIIELKTAKITLEISTDIAGKVNAGELAELITASGIIEAANAAGVDAAAALDAVLNTPDAFDRLLDGHGADAFDVVAAGLDAGAGGLGFGTGLPEQGSGFGDGTGLPGRDGHDWQDTGSDSNTTSAGIDLFAEQHKKDEADGAEKGADAGLNVNFTAQNMTGGIKYGSGSGEIIELPWSNDPENADTAEGSTTGTTGGTTTGTTGGGTQPGDAGKPDTGEPEGGTGTGEGGETGGETGGEGGDEPENEKEAPETKEGESQVNGSGTDGTTTPSDDDIPDHFDIKTKDEDDAPDTGLGHHTQPGLLVEGGIGFVDAIEGPSYGLTQPALHDENFTGSFDADALDPTYGLTNPGLPDADFGM